MTRSSTITLGEICRPRQWPTLSKKHLTPEGYPVYGANGKIGFSPSFTHERPTLLIGCRGSCGTVHITEEFSYANGNAMALDELDEDIADLRYLYHYFSRRGFRDVITGTSQPQIIQQQLKTVEIPLPPLEEQRRIAAILDQCASLTASQELHLSTMRELEGALLHQMDDEMPGGSKAVELKNLVESGDKINYGVVQPGVHVDAGVPLIRVGDLAAGIMNRAAMKLIDPAIESLYSRSRIRGNEILISCVGSIGIIAEARPEDVGSNIARAVARVPVSKDVNRTWLAAYLRSQRVQSYFTNELRTVSQPTLNIKQIQQTEIILPPLEQQQAFAIRLEIVHRKCAQRVYSLQTVKQLADTLATQVFTGGGG